MTIQYFDVSYLIKFCNFRYMNQYYLLGINTLIPT